MISTRSVGRALGTLLLGCLLGSCRGRTGSPLRLRIEPGVTFQTIEGFGTSIDTWTPALEGAHGDAFVDAYLRDLGATVLRVDLWSGSPPERERWEDISFRDFVLDGPGARGGRYVDAAERLAKASDGELRVVASVWSPPGWMKENGSHQNGHPARKNFALSLEDLEGRAPPAQPDDERAKYLLSNRLRPDRYRHFAKVLVEWARLYRSRGAELYGLSPQNEPRFSHWFGSAVYTPSELADVLASIVWMFEHEGEVLPRIFAPETMAHDIPGNRLYLDALSKRPALFGHVGALASHGYTDGYQTDRNPESPERFFELTRALEKPIWATEGGTGEHTWPAPVHQLGTSLTLALTDGHVSLIATWLYVQPKASEHTLVGPEGPTKKTRVAQQFFRFVRPGMRRIQVSGAPPELKVSAFRDPNSRRIVVVLVNRKTEAVRLVPSVVGPEYVTSEAWLTDRSHDLARIDGTQGSVEQPGESVLTLVLSPSSP